MKKNLKLASLRVGLGLTQEELAKELEISLVHMNNIERNVKTPSLKLAIEISECLGQSVNYIWEGEIINE
jgi:DNA-binding XRE family transcriptional regulator